VQEINDNTVLEQAVQGDSEAFGLLYERYITRIYNYIFYRIGSSYDAEDLTERVFMRALRHIGSYNNRGLPFSAWLYRIAHNLVANWYRDNSRRKEIPLDDGILTSHQSSFPEQEVLFGEERERLLRVIRKLPPDRQQLVILKFVDHLSNAEIGQIMGRTEGAVKSLYHRTLLTIRDELLSLSIGVEENIDPHMLVIGGSELKDADRNG
jgi:RNA polymerase sigma-70 factor (ECF subfamily)